MTIFLSYAREDRDIAEQIYFLLINAKHNVFFDLTNVSGGDDYHRKIQRAINKSHLLIFLISPDSVQKSKYAITELNFAREKWPHPKGHVLPVEIRETSEASIPAYLRAIAIVKPEGNAPAEVAKQVAAWYITAKKKRLVRRVLAVGAAIILVAIIIAASWMLGTPSPYQNLITEGDNVGKSYIIPSITMIVKLDTDGEKIVSDTRIVYQVYALKHISSQKSEFGEEYLSISNESLKHLAGSDPEKMKQRDDGDARRITWDAYFALKAGELRTIVTGAHNDYPTKLGTRTGKVFPSLGENEEEFLYNNKEDFIGELVILVESSSKLTLSLQGDQSAGYTRDAKPNYMKANLNPEYPQDNERPVAVVRFRDVKPGDACGIKVAWKSSSNPGPNPPPKSETPRKG